MSKTPPTEPRFAPPALSRDTSVPGQKRPRHYAAEIVALKSRELRAAALERVPAFLRAWVRDLVEDHYWRRQTNTSRESRARASGQPAGAVQSPAAPAGSAVGRAAIAGLKGALA